MLNSRSRASTADHIHHKHGHVIKRRLEDIDIEILKTFRRRRYQNSHFVAAILGEKQRRIGDRMNILCEDSMGYLKMCDVQAEDYTKRIWGFVYRELTKKGIGELSAEGVEVSRPVDKDGNPIPDGLFAHTLMLDHVMDSFETGAKSDGITIDYHDHMPRKIQVAEKRHFISDQGPFSLIKDGKGRHIASVEVDTGSEPIAPADHLRAGPVNKMREVVGLVKDGTISRLYGFKRPYFIWVTRTPARMESFQWHLAKITADEKCIELRKYFLFITHSVFGKRGPKPEPTGHMFTKPYKRAALPDFYLNKQEA